MRVGCRSTGMNRAVIGFAVAGSGAKHSFSLPCLARLL